MDRAVVAVETNPIERQSPHLSDDLRRANTRDMEIDRGATPLTNPLSLDVELERRVLAELLGGRSIGLTVELAQGGVGFSVLYGANA